MSKRYLSLVLIEVPDQDIPSLIKDWFNFKTIHSLQFYEGMLQITFCDGEIQTFNDSETYEILKGSISYIRDLLELDESLSP